MARFKGLRRGEATLANSTRAQRIMRFIRRKPQPVKLVGETEDGEQLTVAIAATAPITDPTLAVMDCVLIRAFDKDGSVLRVLELDPNDPELQAEAELQESRNGGSSRTPIISVDVPKLVDNIARNMREVYVAGADHQSKAFREGFAAMTSVVNLCLNLLARVENRLAAVEADREELLTEGEQTPASPQNALAMQALQKAMGGGGGPNGVDPAQASALRDFMKQFQQEGTANGSG